MPARNAALAACLAALAGCPSMATRQTADTLPPGAWQVLASLDAVGFADLEQNSRIPGLQLEVGARRGLAEDLDAGARLRGFFGLVGEVKWRFRRGPWAMAVVPALDLGWTPETPATTSALHVFGHGALLVTHRLAPCLALTFGPKAFAGVYWPETGGHATGASLGTFAGLNWRFGERWRLIPELDAYRSVAGEVPVRGWSLQAGVGFARDF